MPRPLEQRVDYMRDLQNIKRFRDAFATDDRKKEVRAPVLAACDLIINILLCDHDPAAAWLMAEPHIRALITESDRRRVVNGSK